MFTPLARYRTPWSGKVLVLSPGLIPTVDFYLKPRLVGLGDGNPVYRDSRTFAAGDEVLIGAGVFVVIVRHIGQQWLGKLIDAATRLSGVAFLMDDDIPGAWRCHELPIDYALWTAGRYWRSRNGLAKVCDRIWYSTLALLERYPSERASLLFPIEPGKIRAVTPSGGRRWAYHGTRVHQQEIRWLVPIVEAVQAVDSAFEFEIFGNAGIQRLFSHIPRVSVLPACSWTGYLNHCRVSNLAVGVAPLLPGRFNAYRSHVKVFDIARCGAVGVFSDREPYRSALSGSGSLLVNDSPSVWIDAVVNLLGDDRRRFECFAITAAWIESLSLKYNFPGFPQINS